MLEAFDLRCEHLAAPDGLNTPAPRFSWALRGDSLAQTAWRIRLGGDLIWDSGRRESSVTQLNAYDGPPLGPDLALSWQVMVWDEAGRPSDWSAAAPLRTGPGTWSAAWIARHFVLPAGREAPTDTIYDNPWQARPADYLRRDLTLAKPPVRAVLSVTALGLYEIWINGARVGDHVMAPGWTDYHTRVEYQTHDVTHLLRRGGNVLGAILGEGWYSGRVGHNQRRAGNHYGGRPALLFQLRLTHADGHIETVVSNGDWQTRQGPICYSDFLMGECYDARLELSGWSDKPGPLPGWQPVEVFQPDPRPPLVQPARIQPAREVAVLPARFLHLTPSGRAIFDMGQNFAGYCRLTVRAPAGAHFTLRHAEVLDGGEIYTANLRHAVATDHFIAAGTGEETFKPRFTFHGFRYVEVTLPDGIGPADIGLEGIAIQTDAPLRGTIETGNALVNRLSANILWSQRSNFLSVPTDCPQRDERYGWTADAQVFWKTAGYFMDVGAFLTKWMVDLADGQSPDGAFPDVAPTKPLNPYRLTPQPGAPGWGDGPICMAWEHWQRHGDRDFLQHWWPAFQAWMDHIARANPDFLRRNAVYNNYGDWLSIGPATDRTLVATAYWYRIADLMARMADALGRAQDAARHRQTADAVGRAFRATFLAGGQPTSDTQTACLLPLAFGMLEDGQRQAVAARLVNLIAAADGHLQTGFLGLRHLCPVLSDIGRDDLALDLLLKETYPGWGFSIRNGATTVWERWDGWTPDRGFQSANMNSFNHFAYGAVGEWIWSRLAGIDSFAPGYAEARLHPCFDARIGWVRARHHAPVGVIESAWQAAATSAEWEVCLPPNCSGRLVVPLGWSLSGEPADPVLPPGRHVLRFRRVLP